MEADTKSCLKEIRDRHPKSMIEQLLEVQKHKYKDEKSFEWVRKLQCLALSDTNNKRRRLPNGQWICEPTKVLRRKQIPGCERGSPFVAVSYRWEDPKKVGSSDRRYVVKSPNGTAIQSDVSDEVFDRVVAYTKYHEMDGFWIDKEGINQKNPKEKEIAVHSMDLVYSNSAHPVGLLFTPIETKEDLTLLRNLLRQEFINRLYPGDSNPPRLRQPLNTCMKALQLIDRITSDQWWSRAWIYQEEYRSSVNMDLLIPCTIALSRDEREEFGDIPWELQVKSAIFREQVTLFCLAYLAEKGREWRTGHPNCWKVLRKAKKYTTVCEHSNMFGDGERMKAMSPAIFADVDYRDITFPEDILPIAANCCGYTMRLNTAMLKKARCSLSICILALYLLNGEIFRNDEDNTSLLSSKIFRFLEHQSLDNFDPPVDNKEFTFMKSCRFVDVQLSEDGIETPGWLWKLHKRISTRELARNFASHLNSANGNEARNELSRRQRAVLHQLASILREDGHSTLVEDIKTFLAEDARRNRDFPSTRYKYIMVKEVIRAIENGMILHLGSLMNDSRKKSPYRAIFISDASEDETSNDNTSDYDIFDDDISDNDISDEDISDEDTSDEDTSDEDTSDDVTPEVSYVFTAWDVGRPAEDTRALRDIEKYVSIEVDLDRRTEKGLQRLRTKKWINGLCFFDGYPRKKVVFPWPSSLTE
jgi:Heterokaryon incompatibility protein (HET)